MTSIKLKLTRYLPFGLALVLCLPMPATQAQIYKWVDENGKVHFTDQPPRQEEVEPEVVNIKTGKSISASEFPQVARLEPIKNALPENSKTVALEQFKIEFEGDAEAEKTLGKTYGYTREAGVKAARLRQSDDPPASRLPCLLAGNLTLNNAKFIVKQVDFVKPFKQAFEDNGYAVAGSKTFALEQAAGNDLSLAAVVKDIRLVHCGSRTAPDLRSFTQNSTYLKIEWAVFDNLARRVVYETTTEGVEESFNKPPRFNGAALSASLAFRQATEHLLAQPDFAALLQAGPVLETGYTGAGESLDDIQILPGDPDSSFIARTEKIKQAAVTIRTAAGHGSGFLISAPGYVLTNQHVVAQNREVIVIREGREQRAVVLRSSPGRDVALLRLESGFDAEPMLIDAGGVALGEEIYVVGTPLDERLEFSISRGIISARRVLDQRNYYQTDAAVNPGNSGGPVFNRAGNVIGITVAGLFTRDGSSRNINYVIPILDALAALDIATE